MGVIDFEFPRPYSPEVASVRVAPRSDGRVWVSFREGDGTVVALLDDTGAGEPWVEPSTDGCVPLAMADGGLRLTCTYIEDPECDDDVCGEERVYALDANGEDVAGFPVSLPTGFSSSVRSDAARIVGDEVAFVLTENADELVAEFGEFGSARTLRVGANGSLQEGMPIPHRSNAARSGPTAWPMALPSAGAMKAQRQPS